MRLTSTARRPRITYMRSWRRVVVSLALLLAFTGTVWANCATVDVQEMQMACCQNGQSQVTLAKATTIVKPTLVPLAAVAPPQFSIAMPRGQAIFDERPGVIPFRPPSYIAFSTLLI